MTFEGAAYFQDTLTVEPSEGNRQTDSINRAHVKATLPSVEANEELLLEVGRGSKEALALLFRRHKQIVIAVAWRILRDPSESEDLCQEVFVHLFEKAKQFDRSKGSAISWIIQIAYHRAINRRKHLAIRPHYDAPVLDEEQMGSNDQNLFVNEIVARTLLSRFRAQLPAEQRQTLELHFFEGYTLREIADETGQSLGNVRHHYYRSIERLRALVFSQDGALNEKIGR